ncbi:MAG: cobyrinate a,c-diamide synthase [Pseudomonadota bacterium]|nr:cobyrinate a,c-diamide synthase [Pseudomonadota bacterium]
MIQNASPDGPRGLVIAAPNSNTGKTVFTMGLVRALLSRNVDVEVAKAGPGFIDPQYLARAAGRPCHNLDKWALGAVQLQARARALAEGRDLLVIEGMMGMFDGAASTAGSTADLAATLDLPVLLVVDSSGLAQSIAALVHGYATLRQRPRLCGVIATQVGSPGHAEMLREALIEIGIPMLGALMRSGDLAIPSRHLGLVQASERDQTCDLIEAAKDAVLAGVDLDAILAAARPLGSVQPPVRLPPLGQRIAVAQDEAFEFAYPHLLDDWQVEGAEIIPFSPLSGESPRVDCDAVFLPGGYPELHAGKLAQQGGFFAGLEAARERGALIYGECGGYMVLGRTLIDADGHAHGMAGLLDHVTSFEHQKMHLGYRTLIPQQSDVWKAPLRGHEFHYSVLEDPGRDDPLFQQSDARGTDLGFTGGRRGNVMGSYAHIIDQDPAGAMA